MWASVYYDHLGLVVHITSSQHMCLYTIQAEQATMTILVTMHTHAHVIMTICIVASVCILNRIITQ